MAARDFRGQSGEIPNAIIVHTGVANPKLPYVRSGKPSLYLFDDIINVPSHEVVASLSAPLALRAPGIAVENTVRVVVI
jgi:hypothetical protein